MVEVGGRPVLRHIMRLISHQGLKSPTTRIGYESDYIKIGVFEIEDEDEDEDEINIRYFIFKPGVFDSLGDYCLPEHDELHRLASDGQLAALEHKGFWQPMDPYREALIPRELWEPAETPWGN